MAFTRNEFLKTLGVGALAVAGGGLSRSALAAAPAPRALTDARAVTARMKIKDVEIYAYDMKFTEPFVISFDTIDGVSGVLLRVITDSGLVGLGESSPLQSVTGDDQATNIDVARHLRDLLKGRDPLAIESAHKLFGGYLHSNPSIIAAFDMALYDLLGKAAGLPVFRLLGGDKTTFETDWTTGMDTPEKMVKDVKDHLAKGFKVHKVKLGENPDKDVARLQAIRDAVGDDVVIRIDANQGYTVPQAVQALKRMEKFNLQAAEQPLVASDIEGLRHLRNSTSIPIMADESLFSPHDALTLIRAEAVDYFNIKLMKAGGITGALKISWIAEAAGIPCMVGCMAESRLGLTAAAHVHAARQNLVFADLDAFLDFKEDPIIGGMTVKNGMITMPETPGLGADLDPAFLKRMKRV